MSAHKQSSIIVLQQSEQKQFVFVRAIIRSDFEFFVDKKKFFTSIFEHIFPRNRPQPPATVRRRWNPPAVWKSEHTSKTSAELRIGEDWTLFKNSEYLFIPIYLFLTREFHQEIVHFLSVLIDIVEFTLQNMKLQVVSLKNLFIVCCFAHFQNINFPTYKAKFSDCTRNGVCREVAIARPKFVQHSVEQEVFELFESVGINHLFIHQCLHSNCALTPRPGSSRTVCPTHPDGYIYTCQC